MGSRADGEEAVIRVPGPEGAIARPNRSTTEFELEVIAVRVSVATPTAVPEISDLHRAAVSGSPMPRETRDVLSLAAACRMPTPVFSRDELPIGFHIHGPVIVEEFGATTVIGPDESMVVGELGEIVVTLEGAS